MREILVKYYILRVFGPSKIPVFSGTFPWRNWAPPPLKGILHQKIFYRLNLIFWIEMGCGIARFGRRGLKTTET